MKKRHWSQTMRHVECAECHKIQCSYLRKNERFIIAHNANGTLCAGSRKVIGFDRRRSAQA